LGCIKEFFSTFLRIGAYKAIFVDRIFPLRKIGGMPPKIGYLFSCERRLHEQQILSVFFSVRPIEMEEFLALLDSKKTDRFLPST
jgi:hypothetical protein